MRILLPTDVYPPRCGGSGWSTHALARGLRARGHDVLVVRPAFRAGSPLKWWGIWGKDSDEMPGEIDGVPVRYAGRGLLRILPERIFREFFALGAMRREIRSLVSSWNPDVVHAQHRTSLRATVSAFRPSSDPRAAYHAAPTETGHRGPVVMILLRDAWPQCWKGTAYPVRSEDFRENGWQCARRSDDFPAGCRACARKNLGPVLGRIASPLLRARSRAEVRALRSCDAVIANSSYTARLAEEAGVRPEKIRVIPSVVDLADFPEPASFATRDRAVLFAGKLNCEKGADLVFRFAQENPDVQIRIVGSGSLVPPGSPNLRLLGQLGNRDLLAEMNRVRVVLLPSRWGEPLGRTILEALAVGTPVVTTDTGGTADIARVVNRGAECLVLGTWGTHDSDSHKLSTKHKILKILDLPESEWMKLSHAAREGIRDGFSAEGVLRETEEIYRSVLSSRASASAASS